MKTDLHLIRIDLTQTTRLDQDIKNAAIIQAGRDTPRRLVSSFSSNTQLVLVFELYDQSD